MASSEPYAAFEAEPPCVEEYQALAFACQIELEP
jgi:hypothetical protein